MTASFSALPVFARRASVPPSSCPAPSLTFAPRDPYDSCKFRNWGVNVAKSKQQPTKHQQDKLAELVSRVDSDPALQQRFLADPQGTLAELGLDTASFITEPAANAPKLAPDRTNYWGCLYIGVISPMWCRKTSWGTPQF